MGIKEFTEEEAITSAARFGMVVTLCLGFWLGYSLGSNPREPVETEFIQSDDYDPDVGELVCERVYGKEKETDPHVEYGELVINEWISDDRELVDPEFEITTVVSVFHLYNSYESLNEVWQTYEGITPGETQWGWSLCEHQIEHNYAACDIHTVRPEYVIGDPAMDTIGHEVWHGVAGEFHE